MFALVPRLAAIPTERAKPPHMPNQPVDDCFRPGAPLMRHGEAINLLKSRIFSTVDRETVSLADCAGRIIAEPARAAQPVPAHTNSAVDGYAFASAGYSAMDGTVLEIAARIPAGHPFEGIIPSGCAARIFTGAVMPDGCDTVAMQEDTTPLEQGGKPAIRIPPGLKPRANVRKAGEDVAKDAVLFEPGSLIRPQDLAALASIGLAEATCFKRLEVAIVSTGDEVIRPGSRPLQPGEVYDANAPMLNALAATAGARVTDLGIWPDHPDEIRARLADAASRFDVILTSGGASKGEEDHLAAMLSEAGHRHLWQLAIKPGRPMMFGQIKGRAGDGRARETYVIGLPGNPVAVFVCFLMYVYPMLRTLGGAPWPEPRRLKLPAAFAFPNRKVGRREFWRGMLKETPAGLAVDKYARDGSGLISGLRAADGLIDIPEDHGSVAPGDLVDFLPFSEFGILGR